MIKAIIVEDERLIREGIAEQVPWKDLHIDETRTAENAEVALTLCDSYQPDIIVSDIRMPGMDGITMCTKIKQTLPDAQIIFISGYSDKEYLMSAIGLHAVSYIEKPVVLDELIDAIKNAVDALQKARNEKTNILHTLLNTHGAKKETVSFLTQQFKPGTTYFIAVLKGNLISDSTEDAIQADVEQLQQKLSSCGVPFMTDFIGEYKIAVLFYSDDGEKVDALYKDESFWLSLVSNKDLFAGIGTKETEAQNMKLSLDAACTALKSLSFKGWHHISYTGEAQTEWNTVVQPNVIADFKKALIEKRERAAIDILNSQYKQLVESNCLLTYSVRNIYYTFDEAMQKTFPSLEDESTVKEYVETICELHEFICGKVHEALASEDMQKSSFIANKIISFIQKNYNDKMLSVQTIADAVFLTPTYISCLFKKKTGKTVSQYLQDYRLEKAEQFLKDPQYKIYQISDMVGYEDSHYFAKLFKKQTGFTPSEYRDQVE